MARILVIDDEPNIRKMVGMALGQSGHTIGEAADGREGLETFGDGSAWDLVLLDQRMPGLQGIDVLRQMKALAPRANVVFITAFGTLDLALDVMATGATDFLRKPFPLEALRRSVEAALSHHPVAVMEPSDDAPGAHLRMLTLNGFRIEPLRQPTKRRSGEIQQTVAVRESNENLTPCVVVFPPDLVERVHRHMSEADWPVPDRFWQGLAEEMVANYVWYHAEVPIGGSLRRPDYECYLDRWLSAVVGEGRTE